MDVSNLLCLSVVLFVLYNMTGVRDLSYCRVWWLWETCHAMSFFFLRWVPFVFLHSLYWPLYFYSIVLFAISSLNIYLGLFALLMRFLSRQVFPIFVIYHVSCEIHRVNSGLIELWMCWYSVFLIFVADYYMSINLLIFYTLRLKFYCIFTGPFFVAVGSNYKCFFIYHEK